MKRIAIASVVVAILGVLGYAGFATLQKRALHEQVTHMVAAAAARLGEALGADLNAPSADLIERLDNGIDETDANLRRLRATRARFDPALVEAADAYVANTLAVLLREAGGARGRVRFV